MPKLTMPGPAGGGYTLSLAEPNTAMASMIELERFRRMMADQEVKRQEQLANRSSDADLYLQQQFPQYRNSLKEQLDVMRDQERTRRAWQNYIAGRRPGYFG